MISSDQVWLAGVPMDISTPLDVGQSWEWRGQAICVDGPASLLRLDASLDKREIRRRIEDVSRRRARRGDVDPLLAPYVEKTGPVMPMARDAAIVLSDGISRFRLVPVDLHGSAKRVFWCLDRVPDPDRSYVVVSVPSAPAPERARPFATGVAVNSLIRTLGGDVPADRLRPGAWIETQDHGPQRLLWRGVTVYGATGAGIEASEWPVQVSPTGMAHLDVVAEEEESTLRMAPGQRVALRGRAARDLLNVDEAVVQGHDLLRLGFARPCQGFSAASYVMLMFEHHEMIWADGVLVESFFPGEGALRGLDPFHRAEIQSLRPELRRNPEVYGARSRRAVSPFEALLLSHHVGH